MFDFFVCVCVCSDYKFQSLSIFSGCRSRMCRRALLERKSAHAARRRSPGSDRQRHQRTRVVWNRAADFERIGKQRWKTTWLITNFFWCRRSLAATRLRKRNWQRRFSFSIVTTFVRTLTARFRSARQTKRNRCRARACARRRLARSPSPAARGLARALRVADAHRRTFQRAHRVGFEANLQLRL